MSYMGKIQKVKAYTYKEHAIYKYRLNIPSEVIDELNWKEGTDVDFKVKNKKLVVTKK